ncbi:uncharacterized protein UTRI_02211 [Ustilago trichophora]|uniref:F-box domain-containing protein n=1 Tax=Ustilago trichophora TaxID=86804 RepID=A0A5C3DZ63_9BASI|nr:uncharacterized protein UTRI_02211 [Ustilago trichophora]
MGSQIGSLGLLGALPLDLLVPILSHLRHRVRDLAACALVCRLFNEIATPLLYERLFLRDQTRLKLVFASLGSNPDLCRLVKVIELRVFPFGLDAERLERLEIDIETAFIHAINLEELVWTRAGSLNDRLLPTLLSSSPKLRRLELAGDARLWTTSTLLKYVPLSIQGLSLVLPEKATLRGLVDIAEKLVKASDPDTTTLASRMNAVRINNDNSEEATGLRSLSILCQHSPHLTDAILMALAPHLKHLRRLSLAGCRAVTGRGIEAILRCASQGGQGVSDLAMEGLNIQARDVGLLHPYTSSLRLLSLTYPRSASSSGSRSLSASSLNEFYSDFAKLIEQAENLEELTHYAGSGSRPAMDGGHEGDDGLVDLDELDDDESDYDEQGKYVQAVRTDAIGNASAPWTSNNWILRFSGPPPEGSVRYGAPKTSLPPTNLPLLPTWFLTRLVGSRGAQLTKLRLHGIGLSLDQLGVITQHCLNVRDLVIQIWEDDLPRLAALLCQLARLETLHILASSSSETSLGEREIQWIAQVCTDANRERRMQWKSHHPDLKKGLPEAKVTQGGNGLHQIGFRNRVWLIERHFDSPEERSDEARQSSTSLPNVSRTNPLDERDARDEEEPIRVSLQRWDPAAGTFPEVLLVVKS